ncbi:MAG: AraC family transcriptional regulator [Clostridia bacterium]|nr:AraC family transcriptional regulator [Clostridia bacterium]
MKLTSKKELTPVVYGETAVKILYFRLDENTEGFPPHWHDRIELHLVKSGTLKLNCNGEEVLVRAGELSVISPTFIHSGAADNGGVEYFVLMFDIKDLYNGALSVQKYLEQILNGHICFKAKTDVPRIVSLASDIVEMSVNRNDYHTLEIVGSLYRLLGLLCHCCIDNNSPSSHSAEKFDSVINYINSNFTKNISVNSVSQKFNYEEAYFCRMFKKHTGLTAAKYIRIQRLERARYLLEKTDTSVTGIAISCGFRDSAYFINCFKNMYGTSPLKYRKEHRVETIGK